MRCVIQRVSWARVTVDDTVVGDIGPGALVLLGIGKGDTEQTVHKAASQDSAACVFLSMTKAR